MKMAIERAFPVQGRCDVNSKIERNTPAFSSVPQEFEAMFLQSMLKSTCIEQHFTDNPGSFNIQPCSLADNTGIERLSNNIEPPLASSLVEDFVPVSDANVSVNDFVKSIWPYAQRASALIGLDPKILIAQAALETGWGQKIATDSEGSSHNLFNIKAKSDTTESIAIKTTEYIADMPIKMTASFKKYASVEHSFNDYISLIQGDKRYKTALENAHDPKAYMDSLQQAGYATDPNYSRKILSIYHGDELTRALERM